MKPLDPSLDRLFRAASAVPQPAGAAPAFGLEARVLAAWRSTRGSTAPGWDMGVLGRGLVLASVVMVISIWPAVDQRPNVDSENLQLADSTVQAYPAQ